MVLLTFPPLIFFTLNYCINLILVYAHACPTPSSPPSPLSPSGPLPSALTQPSSNFARFAEGAPGGGGGGVRSAKRKQERKTTKKKICFISWSPFHTSYTDSPFTLKKSAHFSRYTWRNPASVLPPPHYPPPPSPRAQFPVCVSTKMRRLKPNCRPLMTRHTIGSAFSRCTCWYAYLSPCAVCLRSASPAT